MAGSAEWLWAPRASVPQLRELSSPAAGSLEEPRGSDVVTAADTLIPWRTQLTQARLLVHGSWESEPGGLKQLRFGYSLHIVGK